MKKLFTAYFIFMFLIVPASVKGQYVEDLTMDQVISLAHRQSLQSMAAKNTFLAGYWSFRSFKASKLPSLNLTTNLVNFDRSQRALQNYQTGEISYKDNYNMYNTAQLSIDQNIFATGGTVSLYSSLSRLDEWKPTRGITYYSQPITLYYLQPLWSYNRFKWDKKIEPEKYEQSKRLYLENMEDVAIQAVSLFYDVMLGKMSYELSVQNYQNIQKMFNIASERFRIGSYTKADVLQLELRMINDSLSINNKENLYISSQMALKSYLGLDEKTEINVIVPDDIPDIELDPVMVLDKALQNSSFLITQKILDLEAAGAVAQAKGNRGISASLSTQFGLSNNAEKVKRAYSRLLDQEIIGLTLRIPIMDWGMGKGRVMMARAQRETVLNQIDQSIIDFRQEIYAQVMQFNAQARQCRLAKRAYEIAEERYHLTLENFAIGNVSVTDLNNSQSEKDEANTNYISELSNFWNYYFSLRKTALFDFLSGVDISAQYDKLVN